MRVVFACAGTGGHVNPAIAIANKILKEQKNSEILFIGTKMGLENEIVKKSGFDIKHIRTGKIIRKITFKNFKELKNAYLGISDAKKILKEFKPDVVIGTGGYICVPVMYACKSLKIPYMLHESNSFPGLSVKILSKKAKYMMLGFDETRDKLKYKKNLVFTGTPCKFNSYEYNKLDKEECKNNLNLENINKKIVVIACGSQGAKKVNETVLNMLAKYQDEDIYYILVTGNNTYDDMINLKKEIEKNINKSLDKYIRLEKFVFDMAKMYKVADLCITRAGALTINELAITKKRAILIPLPTAAENHQLYNAKVFEKTTLGRILEQKYLNEQSLYSNIKECLNNSEDRNEEYISNMLSNVIVEDSEEKIYECIKNALKK